MFQIDYLRWFRWKAWSSVTKPWRPLMENRYLTPRSPYRMLSLRPIKRRRLIVPFLRTSTYIFIFETSPNLNLFSTRLKDGVFVQIQPAVRNSRRQRGAEKTGPQPRPGQGPGRTEPGAENTQLSAAGHAGIHWLYIHIKLCCRFFVLNCLLWFGLFFCNSDSQQWTGRQVHTGTASDST